MTKSDWSKDKANEIVSERLSKLSPMLTTTQEESDGMTHYKVFYRERVILEVKVSDNGINFPFIYPYDQLAQELNLSLVNATMVKIGNVPTLLNLFNPARTDEYLEMILKMFIDSDGSFPNYDHQGSQNAPLNQILVWSPNPNQESNKGKRDRRSKRRQSQKNKIEREERKREAVRLYNTLNWTIQDTAEHLRVSEETIERDLGKRK